MTGSDKNHEKSRRPGAEDWGWSSTGQVLGGRMIERLGDIVCGMHHRQGVRVSSFGLKTKVYGLSVVWPQNHWDGFPSLGLKTGSSGLVIWASKSPPRFLGLGLKIKRAMVCQLCHKTDGRMKTVWSTRRDLAACFM
jgi:hypothetical protein